MRIAKITYRNRRDYRAIMECEGCGHQQEDAYGYDDRNYHDNVIPEMKCESCGKSRNDLGISAAPTATKYSEDAVV